MTFLFSISCIVIISTAATVTAWEHRGPIVAREEPREYAAWYQMPQGVAAYPPNAYERAVAASAAASQYAGYPRPYSRSPDYYPETAVTNNMVPSSRKAGAAGYYIPGQNPQDTYQISAIDRYFPLLGRKKLKSGKNTFGSRKQTTAEPIIRVASTSQTPPDAASVMRTLKPRRPLIETWKCVKKPCPRTLRPLPLVNGRRTKMIRQNKKVTVTTSKPETYKTFATVEGIKLASVKPYTFRPRHKQSNKKTVKVTTQTTKSPITVRLVTTPSTTTSEAEKVTTTKMSPSTTTQKVTTSSITVTTTTTKPITSTTPKATTTSPTPTTTTTITATTKQTPEVTKRREIRPRITNKTFKPFIKVTPFTTLEPKTLSTEVPSSSSTTSPNNPSTLSSSIATTSKPIDFPYNLLWGKSSTPKPQNSAANSSTPALKPTIPLQVVASRIYQLLERELTNSAIEYEEMRQIREDFKTKPWITEEFITKIEKVVPERKPKQRKEIVVKEVESYEDDENDEMIPIVAAPEKSKRKRPNAELISAIKDVVRKFKASLDRTGVQDDVRQMSTQLESTWNDLRRGINRSWTAFRQSAETALLSPSLSTSASSSSTLLQQPPSTILLPPGILPPPGSILTSEPYPYIITSASAQQQQQLKHSSIMKDSRSNYNKDINNNNNNTNMYLQNDINNGNGVVVVDDDVKMLYNGSEKKRQSYSKKSPFSELLLQNLYDSNVKDSGKLESWIERAHQMLADSVSEDDVKSLLESQQKMSKIAKNPAQSSIIPKEKPNKSTSSVIKAEKINPKFYNEINQARLNN